MADFVSDHCLGENFGTGSFCGMKKGYGLLIGLKFVPFGYIACYAHRGTSNLIAQTKILDELASIRQPVNMDGKVLRSLPDFQVLKITHDKEWSKVCGARCKAHG